MPLGGQYGTTRVATVALVRAAHFESGKFFVLPAPDSPSFCSGATYLVFLKAIEQLERDGRVKLDADTMESLVIHDGQRDGDGAAVLRAGAREEFYRFCRCAAGGFHEDILDG